VPARGHRSNKDVIVGGMTLHANSIAQYGTAGKGRTRIDANHTNLIERLGVTDVAARESPRDEMIRQC
jgi:hypothetical protein